MDYFFISGRSMEPFLMKKKDLVVAETSNIRDVAVGDIITFYNKDKELIESKTNIICHRVVAVRRTKGNIVLIEKGDNFLECSEVDESNFIGKVRMVYKNNEIINLSSKKWKVVGMVFAIISKLSLFYNIKIMKRINLKHKKGIQYKLELLMLRVLLQ